jgi:hypothetical protein
MIHSSTTQPKVNTMQYERNYLIADPESQRDAVMTQETIPVELGHAVAEFSFDCEDGMYNEENRANDRLKLRGADITDLIADYFYDEVQDALKQAGFLE